MKLLKRSLVLLGCALVAAAAFTACELGLGDGEERESVSGLQVTALTVSGQRTVYEQGEEFSLGTDAAITATYINDDTTKASVSKDDVKVAFKKSDGTALADFTTAEAGTKVTVTLSYTSGGKTAAADYDVEITLPVTGIKVKGVKAAYVYNPGALDTALDTAIEYEVEAAHGEDPSTILQAGYTVTVTTEDGKKGVKVTYTSAVGNVFTDFYTIDDVKSAVTNFTVQSGVQYGLSNFTSAYNAPTPDIVIPNGKTMVATFMNYGSGNETWDNFNIEFFAPGGLGITLRADRWGWKFGEGTDYNNGVNIDTAEWQEANTELGAIGIIAKDTLNGKRITVIVKNTGDNIIVDCTSQDVEGFKLKYTIPITSENAKNNTTLHFQEPASYIVFD